MATLVPENDLPDFGGFVPVPANDLPDSVMSKPKGRDKTDWLKRLSTGYTDPFNAIAQVAAKGLTAAGLPPPFPVDQNIKDAEKQYQEQRGENAGTLDVARMVGNIVNPINVAITSKIPMKAGFGAKVLGGAAAGAGTGALNPVYDGDFLTEKAKQAGVGAAVGGAVPVAMSGISRLISPKASVNPNLQLLKSEGVRPTIGQTLGGRWNSLEEKLMSVPILGDSISSARAKSLNQFNSAAINRATTPIGESASGIGFQGVKSAGDALGASYDKALNKIGSVTLDDTFAATANAIRAEAQSLPPDFAKRFAKKVGDLGNYTVNTSGKMTAEGFKGAESMLSKEIALAGKDATLFAADYVSKLEALQSALRENLARANPEYAKTLASTNAGWANLVRVEGAAKAGKNAEGIFTPAQLNMAIQQADQSTRGRAVSRGSALMQDLGNAGQQVLGNKVPNSFTTDRALIAGGALGSYFVNPAIPAGLLGGAAMYTNPMQAFARAAVSSRPSVAPLVGEAIKKGGNLLIPSGSTAIPYLINNQR